MIALSGHASLAASTLLLAMTKKGATTHINEYKGGLRITDTPLYLSGNPISISNSLQPRMGLPAVTNRIDFRDFPFQTFE